MLKQKFLKKKVNTIDLSIIIVNFNVKEFLQNLLNSIQRSSSEITKEIIVIDNASDDGSVEILREKFPEVKLIANKVNIGFGKANNMGLEIAKGKYILLINPDTIVQEDTFDKIISFMDSRPEAGLVGCKVLNSDGTLQLACRRSFPGPWVSFTKVTGLGKMFPKSKLFARYNLTYLDENETCEVDAISGCFMMLRKDTYDKTGGFDSRFFMYGEDLDLCYRVQKSGAKVYYLHTTQIIHYKGESTKRSNMDETKVFYDAMHLFVKKYFSSSFLVIILRFAIALRKTVAFVNLYKLMFIAIIFDFLFFDFSLFLSDQYYTSVRWHGIPKESFLVVYTIPAIIQIFIGLITGSYRKDSFSVLRILYAIFTGFFALSSVTFFFKQYAYSRAVVLLTYILLFVSFPLWRMLLKIFFKLGRTENFNKYKTLVVGTDQASIELSHKLKARFTSIHNIEGLIGINRKHVGEKLEGFEVMGSIDNIKKIIREKKINEVIFSSNEITYNRILGIVSECQGENVDFKLAGREMDFLVGKSSITMLDDISLLEIEYNISILKNRIIKAMLDYAITIPALILIYPFIYSCLKFGGKENDFTKLISGLPNVFLRKNSLVGPMKHSTDPKLYLGKEGLTGLWFTDLFDHKDENDIIKLDIFYAKNQNTWLDLEILGKTFSKMINGMER
ncbi:MAG: glycosyltransferase [Ignavibacteria bacterium]